MSTELAKVEIPTPILDTINHVLTTLLQKNLNEVTDETNRAIEIGVKTDENAANANSAVQQANKVMKAIKEVRLQYTRPIDDGKKRLMREVEAMLQPLVDSNKKLDDMVMEREREIERKKARAQREAEEAQQAADEKARKEQERREKISIAKGGDGNVKPVEAEIIIAPVSQIDMRSTVRKRSIPDLEKIEEAVESGVRVIRGVKIYQAWQFKVEEAKEVPEAFRRITRG